MRDRLPFRFRLPWLSSVNPPSPTDPPTPPSPSRTPTSQRPPFRPPGIAPSPQSQPPPRPQVAARTAPQPQPPPPPENQAKPPSPPRTTTQTQATSAPPSPPLRRKNSKTQAPSAPSPAATSQRQAPAVSSSLSTPMSQTQASAVPQSPSQTAVSSAQQPRQPKSPPRPAPDEPIKLISSEHAPPSSFALRVQSVSPPKKSQPTTRDESLKASPLPGSTQLPLSQEKGLKPLVPEIPPQMSQLKSEITQEDIKVKVDRTTKLNHQSEERMRRQQKKDQDNKLMEQGKEKNQDKGPAGQEMKKDQDKGLIGQENKKDRDNEDTTHRIMTPLGAALDSVKGARDLLDTKFQFLQRNQEKQDFSERKKILGRESSGHQIKTIASTHHPKERSIKIDTHQNIGEANEELSSPNKGVREDINEIVSKLALAQPDKSLGEKHVSVVTLAGENKGTMMHIGSESAEKEKSVHIHRGYKSNPDESPYATTDGEGSSKRQKPKEETPVKAYLNSNIQNINNSIFFDSSVNEKNPGVHMAFCINRVEPTNPSTKRENIETRKSEISLTPAEKLTHETTVRRRCLRGLFAEPSDSEPENPQKPRRHGCRFRCGDKGKDKDIGVL